MAMDTGQIQNYIDGRHAADILFPNYVMSGSPADLDDLLNNNLPDGSKIYAGNCTISPLNPNKPAGVLLKFGIDNVVRTVCDIGKIVIFDVPFFTSIELYNANILFSGQTIEAGIVYDPVTVVSIADGILTWAATGDSNYRITASLNSDMSSPAITFSVTGDILSYDLSLLAVAPGTYYLSVENKDNDTTPCIAATTYEVLEVFPAVTGFAIDESNLATWDDTGSPSYYGEISPSPDMSAPISGPFMGTSQDLTVLGLFPGTYYVRIRNTTADMTFTPILSFTIV